MEKRSAREKILEAALKQFANKGFEATTTKDIAMSAEVNEVTIFRIFGSKVGLLGEVYKEFSPTHLNPEKLRQHLTGDLKHDLKAIAYTYIKQSLEHQDYIRMTFFEALRSKELSPKVAEIPQKLYMFLEAYLEELYTKGKIHKANFKALSKVFYNILFQYILTSGSILGNATFQENYDEYIEASLDLFTSSLDIKRVL